MQRILLLAGIAHYAAAVTTTSSCLKGKETLLAPLASNSAVLQYCSSYYPVAAVTSTATATATTTTTLGSTILTTTTVVDSVTSTSTEVDTTTTTIFETDTSTTTTYQTVTVNEKREARSLPTPAAVANLLSLCAAAKAEVSHICSCFEKPKTTTTTITTTSTATAISSTTDVIQATSFTTVVPVVTVTQTASTTSTETVTSTVVVAATATQDPPYCNGEANTLGTGGCSSNCYCDARNQGGPYICDDSIACGRSCSRDSDCALGQACINDSSTGPCGGPTCVDYSGCSSSYSPSKRGLEFMRGNQDSAFVVKKGEEVWARDGAVVGVALSRPDGSLS